MNNPGPYASNASDLLAAPDKTCKGSLLLMVIAVLLSICMAVGMLMTQQSFKKMFVEFGVNRSTMNVLATSTSLPLSLLFAVIVTIAKEFVVKSRRIANVWNAALICFAMTCLFVYLCGTIVPIVNLVRDLGE